MTTRTTLGLVVALALMTTSGAAEPKKPDPVAVDRTREQAKMLDDLYKNAVVAITNAYTENQADTPAAAVAKQVFDAMHKKGWHTARLIDVTGKPKNPANVAKSEFEKKAAPEILAGKGWIEEVAEAEGKPVLRVATVVPSVLKQCALCHGGKEGRVLGAIIYEIPIK